jgi:tetratricopeptide (TPR) repeat protein
MSLHTSVWMAFRVCIASVALVASAGSRDAGGAAASGNDEHLGAVSFPVSCTPSVRASFSRGVALLHDFWYEEARPQFEKIVVADPSCAMAHWGIAMSAFHQIWDRPDAGAMAKGWRELQAAQSRPAKTAREREYIAALSGFFKPGTEEFQARIDAYAAAMATLHAHYPADVDAGAFYALALLAAEPPDDTSLTQEKKAMAVLTPLWQKYPDNPGVVHYIIHACDTPSLAPDGLAAARHYGEIASSGPHAVHMPGHIFARLGMWPEDIDANLGSVAASRAAEARHESGWMDQFHSDDFLVYAYLQSGDDARARAIAADAAAAIAHYEAMPDMAADHYMTGMFPYYRVKFPIFIALETRDWKSAATLEPVKGAPAETQGQVYWARAIGDGHLHRPAQARADLAAYDASMDEVRKGSHAYFADSTGARIRHEEMLAWAAFAGANTAEAFKHMRAAADLQDRVGQGEVDIPSREMLADMLLESAQPQQALVEYRQAMKLSPNRFNGLFGAGSAAEAAGETGEARRYYAALLKSTGDGAGSDRPEIAHAKALVMSARVGMN